MTPPGGDHLVLIDTGFATGIGQDLPVVFEKWCGFG